MPIVKATREGLIDGRTSTGYLVDLFVPFVALPAIAALHQWVDVFNVHTGARVRAIVLDVGPWNVHDTPYVFGLARPQAESGADTRGRKTNGAGIDLSEHVWHALALVDNDLVQWEFCEPAHVDRGEQLDASAVADRLAQVFPQLNGRRRADRPPRIGPAAP